MRLGRSGEKGQIRTLSNGVDNAGPVVAIDGRDRAVVAWTRGTRGSPIPGIVATRATSGR